MKRWRALIEPVVTLGVLALAVWLLQRKLSTVSWEKVKESFQGIPAWRIMVATAVTVLNYLILIGYDWLALLAIHRRLPFGKVCLASYTGFVSSYNFGSLLGGMSVRYRMYTAWGLSAFDVARLAVSLGVTFWIGLAVLACGVFVLEPLPIPADLGLPLETTRPLGLMAGAVALAYVGPSLWSAWRQRRTAGAPSGAMPSTSTAGAAPASRVRKFLAPVRVWWREIAAPDWRVLFGQLFVAALDFAMAAGVLWVLIADCIEIDFWQFLSVYLLANVATVLMHVPGGFGVLEWTVLTLAAPFPEESGLAALLAFRLIYYLFPLLLGAVLFAGNELAMRRATVGSVGRWLGPLVPTAISWWTWAAGAALLVAAARPAMEGRLDAVAAWLPLPALEAAHWLSAVCGAALVLLARGLQRRLLSAYRLALVATAAGAVCSVGNRLGLEEAAGLALLVITLVVCRRRFYRRVRFLDEPWTAGWIVAVLLAALGAGWLGFFLHRHADYASNLWWTFDRHGDAGRFVRAGVGVLAVLLVFAGRRLLRPHQPRPRAAESSELSVAAAIVARSPRTLANLALLGDKAFRFNRARTAFVMYAVHGRSWIALGDPVGPEAERAELIWDFREACDEYGAWSVFYQVAPENQALYREHGLTLLAVGEEARVPLAQFALATETRRALRDAWQRLQTAGWEWTLVPADRVADSLPELRSVSDAWLTHRHATEKRFALGYFDADYLCRFPSVLVRQHGQIVAFATLWTTPDREELAVDLLRYRPDVADGAMDFLLVELMHWGRREGYRWFNLGLAPPAGTEDRALEPLWHPMEGNVFRHGDHFASAQALREYKARFGPQWTPQYLACPGSRPLAQVMTDVSLLINRK